MRQSSLRSLNLATVVQRVYGAHTPRSRADVAAEFDLPVGEGLAAWLAEQARKHKVLRATTFVGHLDHEQLVQLLHTADAAVLPEHDCLIVDEAHDLVDRVTGVATGELTATTLGTAVRRGGRLVDAAHDWEERDGGADAGQCQHELQRGRRL